MGYSSPGSDVSMMHCQPAAAAEGRSTSAVAVHARAMAQRQSCKRRRLSPAEDALAHDPDGTLARVLCAQGSAARQLPPSHLPAPLLTPERPVAFPKCPAQAWIRMDGVAGSAGAEGGARWPHVPHRRPLARPRARQPDPAAARHHRARLHSHRRPPPQGPHGHPCGSDGLGAGAEGLAGLGAVWAPGAARGPPFAGGLGARRQRVLERADGRAAPGGVPEPVVGGRTSLSDLGAAAADQGLRGPPHVGGAAPATAAARPRRGRLRRPPPHAHSLLPLLAQLRPNGPGPRGAAARPVPGGPGPARRLALPEAEHGRALRRRVRGGAR
eukprot:2206901-Rhodomonas_salina.1